MSEDRLVIIDGYNLIHRAPTLRPGPGRTLQQAREKLVNLLSWAVGSGEARFLVIFDGAEGGGGRDERQTRVEVRFSRPPRKADDLIRDAVEEAVEKVERVTVVTADLEVARHARAMGADIAISDLFMSSVLGPTSPKSPGDPDTAEKPTTLSKQELAEWAEIFRARRPGEERTRSEEEEG
jgi:predicted RNA-binding protein with PIN domain